VACPVRPGEQPDLAHGLQVDVVCQVGCHPARDVVHAPDPFPATARTGCCQAAGCLDDAHRERQGVLPWNQAVAAEEQRVLRRSERRAQPDQGRAVRLGEELPSAAAQLLVALARVPVWRAPSVPPVPQAPSVPPVRQAPPVAARQVPQRQHRRGRRPELPALRRPSWRPLSLLLSS
jgi:hypothetical protein